MRGRASPATEFATFGPVHLSIIDLERSLGFWRDLVGLAPLNGGREMVGLGVDGESLVTLQAGATSPVRPRHSGLYHLAIHLPSEPELARVLARLLASRHPISPTDHVMSKSIYLDDPDGIGLELTLETPERLRELKMDPTPHVVDVDGNISNGRNPLDIEKLLARLPDGEIERPLPSGTKIGHIHLHVDDLDAGLAFYRDQLGFVEHMVSPALGIGDLHAGGAFPHRIALNTWQGAGAPQPPPETAGLRLFTITYDTNASFDHALRRLGHEPETDRLAVRDPAGNHVLLTKHASATPTSSGNMGRPAPEPESEREEGEEERRSLPRPTQSAEGVGDERTARSLAVSASTG